MPAPRRGLHELLITELLRDDLEQLDSGLSALREPLHHAEAPDRLALHFGHVLRRALESLRDEERVTTGIALARELITRIAEVVGDTSFVADRPLDLTAAERDQRVLRAIRARLPDGSFESIVAPLTPLIDTTLLTNAPDEPRLGSQLLAETMSADRIDVLMAFVRLSGIRPMLEALRRHCERGAPLRLLTTTYTNSTERAALDRLRDLGAEIRVSYDESSHRLHAKAWLFHRESGATTAFVGSSNLTFSAQQAGLEWNVRISNARNPDVIAKMCAVFESYWHGVDFRPYEPDEFDAATARVSDGSRILLSPIELHPYPFQERLLEQLALARSSGHHRNLLVAATGTGKTVMAALDYLRLRVALPRARLLFVAHRQEILAQSLAIFRHGARDASFGELWVGGRTPRHFEHVFASIQTLRRIDHDDLAPDHFDVVIVDEFHHAAAASYRQLLAHLRPRELLGLTATPERGDGYSVAELFDGRIAAELRLWHAIDQQRLCPFLYYGIGDEVDFREVPWQRGRGYDIDALSRVLTSDAAAARHVLHQLREHVDDVATARCLGFCVSVAHAEFMAAVFNRHGVTAAAVTGATPESERGAALRRLASGELQVLFSVDLFNEGLDVPRIDTVLFLRPTDSPVLFLQQLGRGLRKSPDKAACTVLDFVGHHRREFRFDRRFAGLFEGGRRRLVEQIQRGFPFLPAGCHMQLDRVAAERVLANIKAAVPSYWHDKAHELRAIARASPTGDVSLAAFLLQSGLELDDVYPANQSDRGWSDLRETAGLPVATSGPHEIALRRACGRLRHVDDHVRLDHYRRWLRDDTAPDLAELAESERRVLRMLVASIVDKVVAKQTQLAEGIAVLWQHPQVRAELAELFDVLVERIDHLHEPLHARPNVPLMVHARYTRIEIQAAFGLDDGRAKIAAWQTGVRWLPADRVDLLAFTLDKSVGSFSPTTRYRDYAMSPELVHWESQGVVRAESPTGQRYQRCDGTQSVALLFARLRADERAFWFLGPARYVSHRSERPMQITWRLDHPLSGDLFAAFAAAVA